MLFQHRFHTLGWAFVDQSVVSAGNFLTSLFIARFLGVEAFGVFTVVWYVLLFMQSIQASILTSVMLTVGPKIENDTAAYYSATETLQIMVAVISALLSMGVLVGAEHMLGIGEWGKSLALPLAGVIVVTQLHEFFRSYCYARELSRIAFRIDLVRYSTQLILLALLVAYGRLSLPLSLLAIAVATALGIIVMFNYIPSCTWTVAPLTQVCRRHWHMTKWLMPSNLVFWLTSNLFVFASSGLLGPQTVGAMRACQNLMGVTHIFFQAMDRWASVRAARIFASRGIPGLRRFTRKMHLFIGGATLTVVLLLTLPAGFWLTLLYGAKYKSHAWMVAWYGAAYLIVAANAPLRYAWSAVEKFRPVFLGYFVAAIFSICMVYPLLHKYQAMGALVGTLCCNSLVQLVMSLSWRQFIRENLSKKQPKMDEHSE